MTCRDWFLLGKIILFITAGEQFVSGLARIWLVEADFISKSNIVYYHRGEIVTRLARTYIYIYMIFWQKNKDYSRSVCSNEPSFRQNRDLTMLIHFLKVPSLVMHLRKKFCIEQAPPTWAESGPWAWKNRDLGKILKSRKSHPGWSWWPPGHLSEVNLP